MPKPQDKFWEDVEFYSNRFDQSHTKLKERVEFFYAPYYRGSQTARKGKTAFTKDYLDLNKSINA